jgi:uncharacterized protein Yka (UPF0111/DUF47 family)
VRFQPVLGNIGATMFSLQRLLGNEDKFFSLLEASAEEARTSVQTLVKLGKNPGQTNLLYDFIQSRRKEKQIREQITEAVYTTFVTALEREDIDNLSHALYRIPKSVEKFVERLLLAPPQIQTVDFSKQITLLDQATDTVQAMIKNLRSGANLDQTKTYNDKLQYLEGEADKAMLGFYKDLYSGAHDPIRVIVLKDLYELLEKVIDRCRDVGNIVSQIMLKNS